MTGNWHMNGKNVVYLGDPSGAADASNKKKIQGDIKMNNDRIRNLYKPVQIMILLIRQFVRQHAEKSD